VKRGKNPDLVTTEFEKHSFHTPETSPQSSPVVRRFAESSGSEDDEIDDNEFQDFEEVSEMVRVLEYFLESSKLYL